MDWVETIRHCFQAERAYYSGHARREMRNDEYGVIIDQEVYEAILYGEVIEVYNEDTPFPSALVFGLTETNRPLHLVCAYNNQEDRVIVVTVYQPDPNRWEDYRRRK